MIWGFTTLEWREIGVPRMDLENQQAHPALLWRHSLSLSLEFNWCVVCADNVPWKSEILSFILDQPRATFSISNVSLVSHSWSLIDTALADKAPQCYRKDSRTSHPWVVSSCSDSRSSVQDWPWSSCQDLPSDPFKSHGEMCDSNVGLIKYCKPSKNLSGVQLHLFLEFESIPKLSIFQVASGI